MRPLGARGPIWSFHISCSHSSIILHNSYIKIPLLFVTYCVVSISSWSQAATVAHWMATPDIVGPFISWWTFTLIAYVWLLENAAVDIRVKGIVWTHCHISWVDTSELNCWVTWYIYSSLFKNLSNGCPKWLPDFSFPPATNEGSTFFHSHQHPWWSLSFDCSHPRVLYTWNSRSWGQKWRLSKTVRIVSRIQEEISMSRLLFHSCPLSNVKGPIPSGLQSWYHGALSDAVG